MPASQKIITKLHERRQIEADLRKMEATTSEPDLQLQAQRIASLGSAVIPALVGNLDRAGGQLLRAMGSVAAHLDREKVSAALHEALHDPKRTDRGRMAALTILEQFLGETVNGDLAEHVVDPEAVAMAALPKVLEQGGNNPGILIDYVQSLDKQEPDVVLAVLRTLRDREHSQVVALLRMMAQDVREEIAGEALQALGALRQPESARAVQTLIPIVQPNLRDLGERLLRKLQFAGVKVTALPPAEREWRALVGPIDGTGQQPIWFVQEHQRAAWARFLRVLTNDQLGAVQAAGHGQVPTIALPPRRPPGHLHDIVLPDGPSSLLMLEGSFDLGRRLVRQALVHNWETQIPVAGPLRLLSAWLWSSEFSQPQQGGASVEPVAEQVPSSSGGERLLAHPAFSGWVAQGEEIFRAAEEISRHSGRDLGAWSWRLAGEIFLEAELIDLMRRRLTAMSEWLLLAGDGRHAREALAVAQSLPKARPQDHPFLLALVRRGLELAISSLNQRPDSLLENTNQDVGE